MYCMPGSTLEVCKSISPAMLPVATPSRLYILLNSMGKGKSLKENVCFDGVLFLRCHQFLARNQVFIHSIF